VRLETKFVQVPNNPQTINAINNIAAVWGWSVQGIQVTDNKITYEGDSHGWVSDYGAYVQTEIITEHTNYASITYQRDLDHEKYNQLKFFEDKYADCDNISYLNEEETREVQRIRSSYDTIARILTIVFVAAVFITYFCSQYITHILIGWIIGAILCFAIWKGRGFFKDYNNSTAYIMLMKKDKTRRAEAKQKILDQAKMV